MKNEQKEEVRNIVIASLKRAEELWSKTLGKEKLVVDAALAKTPIPGHRYLGTDEYKSDCFIALMLDMRDSKTHLLQAISPKTASVSQMQRVYYEVSALLPASAKIIDYQDGAVTEYLGDGLLALFQYPFENKEKREDVIRKVYRASSDCFVALQEIINPILNEKYTLPALDMGIGLAFSDAIITHFGIKPNTQVKVIGKCIYDASRLSKEINKIVVHKGLEEQWPQADDGKLKFTRRSYQDVDGFIIEKGS